MIKPKNLGDVIGEIVRDRDAVLSTEDEEARHVKASDTLSKAMFLVHKLLGDEVLKAALGSVDEGDPVAVLKVASARLLIYAGLFHKIPEDAASPIRVTEEAMAVASGDAPAMFAKLKGVPKTKHREHRLKLRALVWDAYLKERGMNSTERAYVIGKAYNADWSTINTSWRRDIRSLDDSYISFMIALGKKAASMGTADWEVVEVADERAKDPVGTKDLEDWEVAMAIDVRHLQEARRMSAAAGR